MTISSVFGTLDTREGRDVHGDKINMLTTNGRSIIISMRKESKLFRGKNSMLSRANVGKYSSVGLHTAKTGLIRPGLD